MCRCALLLCREHTISPLYVECLNFVKEVVKVYGLIVLLAYAVIMIAATLLFTKKETTADGFLAGNHIHISRKSIHKRYTGVILVFSAECAMLIFIYTVCNENKKRITDRNFIIRVYV